LGSLDVTRKELEMTDLEIAEIPHENGTVRFRYARYLSDDGTRWIRHGLFVAYSEDGAVRSEGHYEHGLEHGEWKDFHPNGQIAAHGRYERGKEVGDWQFWKPDGTLES
jgi:antitoxin component YwqK of YwqJK toxin-antitoxin module